MNPPNSRGECLVLDAGDPLRANRERFTIPADRIYLDGNSLGALPRATPARLADVIAREWGNDLITSWNRADWVRYPQRLGDQIAPLVGATQGEVVVTDSTSVNIFKLLAAVLSTPTNRADRTRNVILSERGNFPTDLYIAEGICSLLEGRYELRLVESAELGSAMNESVAVALITHVDYRSGRMHDMAAMNQRANAAGINVIWDLSHSAGAVPLALNEDRCHFAVGCGYKYLNGGPGAPAFCYVATEQQASLHSPLTGWFAHAQPFAFAPKFEEAPGIEKFLCGTPSILGMAALECGLDTFAGVDMAALRKKSLALTRLFAELVARDCAQHALSCLTPAADHERGSHVSFSFAHGYSTMQALISRGVVGDFRAPDVMRFGFTPLYTRFVDCWDAVAHLREVLDTEQYQRAEFNAPRTVT